MECYTLGIESLDDFHLSCGIALEQLDRSVMWRIALGHPEWVNTGSSLVRPDIDLGGFLPGVDYREDNGRVILLECSIQQSVCASQKAAIQRHIPALEQGHRAALVLLSGPQNVLGFGHVEIAADDETGRHVVPVASGIVAGDPPMVHSLIGVATGCGFEISLGRASEGVPKRARFDFKADREPAIEWSIL